MRLVDTDNFDIDYPDEKFFSHIPTNINSEDAQRIANIVNKCNGEHDQRYCKVVENDYELSGPFEP